MISKQTTIKSPVSLDGVGIHTGKDVKLTFNPAEANTGSVSYTHLTLPTKA